MVKRIVFFIGVFSLVTLGCFAQVIEAEGRYWMANLSAQTKVAGDINVSGVTIVQGSDIDLKSDLGLEDENFAEARVTVWLGPLGRVRAAYMPISYSGQKTITKTIDFYGQSYSVGFDLASEFNADYIRVGWYNQFNLFDKVKVGPLVDIKGIISETSITTASGTQEKSKELNGVLPTIGMIAEINPIEDLSFCAEVSGLSAGDYGYFVDAELGLKWSPVSHLYIKGGWRLFEINLESDDDYLKLKLSGPFAGMTLEF